MLANTASAAINVYLLIFGLKKKLSKLEFGELRLVLLQMMGAGILAGILAYGTSYLWETKVGNGTLFERIGAVFVPMGVSVFAYIAALLWMRVPQAHDILQLIHSRVIKKGE